MRSNKSSPGSNSPIRPNFKFNLEVRPSEEYKTGVLIATATDRLDLPIPVRCQWKKIVGDRTTIITDVTSNVYQPSCEDIGSYITVEAYPLETDMYTGVGTGQIGPIQLEGSLRKSLEYLLIRGESSFDVILENKENAILKIQGDEVSLVNAEKTVIFTAQYTINYPKIILNPLNTKRLTFVLTQDLADAEDEIPQYDRKVLVEVPLRQTRDLIVLTIRGFATRNYIVSERPFKLLFQHEKRVIINGKEMYLTELILELDRRVRELHGILLRNREISLENQKTSEEILHLESEMKNTISSYQLLLNTDPNEFADEQIEQIRGELETSLEIKRSVRQKCEDLTFEIEMYKQNIMLAQKNADLQLQIEEKEAKQAKELEDMKNSQEIQYNQLQSELMILQKENQHLVEEQETWLQKEKKMNMGLDNDLEGLKNENERLKLQRNDESQKIDETTKIISNTRREALKLSEELQEATDRLEVKSKNQIQEIMYVEETMTLTEELEQIKEEINKYKSQAITLEQQLETIETDINN